MKVFKQSSRLFKWMCFITPDYKNKWKNRGCRFNAVFIVAHSFIAGWSSYLFFEKYYSITKEDAFCAIYQLVAIIGSLSSFSVAQLVKKGSENNFADYQNFYEQNKNMDPMGFMQKAEKRGRKLIMTLSVGIGSLAALVITVTGFGNLLYHRYKEDGPINYGDVHRSYRLVLPWDRNTPSGWIFETVFIVPFPIIFCSSSSGYGSLLASTCEYHIAFCKIVNHHIENIHDVVRSGTYRLDDLKTKYDKTVSFHLAAKELFVKSDNIYCLFIAIELLYLMLFSTFVILHYDHAIRHLNLHFMLMTCGMVYGVAMLYLYCEYGQRATDSYAAIADHLYESDWMNLPIGLRRMYVLMIAHAQKKLHFRGAGMVELRREAFLRMGKTIVGYVLMFKTFAESS